MTINGLNGDEEKIRVTFSRSLFLLVLKTLILLFFSASRLSGTTNEFESTAQLFISFCYSFNMSVSCCVYRLRAGRCTDCSFSWHNLV